jgi:alcohol dehydrogenase class IV
MKAPMDRIGSFEFAAPGRILFGLGRVAEAGGVAAGLLGKGGGASTPARAILVSGGEARRLAPLLASLEASGLEIVHFTIKREPRFEDAQAALDLARGSGCGLAIGFGGGSAIDLAKAVAALLANPGEVLDYAEVIGGGKALSRPSYPCIAIPTTAGTGSEATRNAVLASSEKAVKVSLRSPTMLPSFAIVDPELSYSLPPRQTAETGMDALTQLIEPLVCSAPNPFVDALCREAIPRVARSLPLAFADGGDTAAREGMAFASLSGGMALANARLGAVHGIAGPLGGSFPVPHGAACAALLAPVAAVNVAALRSREPESPALSRYAEVAASLSGGKYSSAEDAAPLLRDFASNLGLRSLAAFGLRKEDFPLLVTKAEAASSMRGNPIKLTADEIRSILESAL